MYLSRRRKRRRGTELGRPVGLFLVGRHPNGFSVHFQQFPARFVVVLDDMCAVNF